jgi:hypothetical protein
MLSEGLLASYDSTFLAVMENNDISVETQLKRAFGRAQLLFEIPPILSVEVGFEAERVIFFSYSFFLGRYWRNS